jgi:hypothetical protein
MAIGNYFDSNKTITEHFQIEAAYGASVTILCLHVFIARRILLILDMLIIFSKYRCILEKR